MSELMIGLEFAKTYLDDLLVLSKDSFGEHLNHLTKVHTKLQEAGLKINAVKSFSCREEVKYLSYWITTDGIRPVNKEIKAIKNLATPKTRRELRRYISMVNDYQN